MIFKKTPPVDQDLVARFLEETRSHLGYRTRPGGLSDFGARVGYNGHGLPWSGAFVDCVAKSADLTIPSCVYTPAGLAEFSQSRRTHLQPAPGDIVFYSFQTGTQFGMPHCGIVTDVTDWRDTGRFKAIEGNVSSGLPKGSTDADGVFERVRSKHEVIAFGRPNFERRPAIEKYVQTGIVSISLSKVRPARQNPDVQTVQDALGTLFDLQNYTPGKFDSSTQQLYSRWQRQIGYVHPDATGIPDQASLSLLGERTGIFTLKPEN